MAMPGLMDDGRRRGLAVVTLVTLVQGAAAGAAAFATRGLFEAMHAGGALPPGLIAALAVSGLVIAGARVLARLTGERLGQDYGRTLSTHDRSALSLARILLGRPQLVLLGDGAWHLDPKARHILTAHLETSRATVLRHPALSQASGNGPLAA